MREFCCIFNDVSVDFKRMLKTRMEEVNTRKGLECGQLRAMDCCIRDY
jgi:hypothetical protein